MDGAFTHRQRVGWGRLTKYKYNKTTEEREEHRVLAEGAPVASFDQSGHGLNSELTESALLFRAACQPVSQPAWLAGWLAGSGSLPACLPACLTDCQPAREVDWLPGCLTACVAGWMPACRLRSTTANGASKTTTTATTTSNERVQDER